MNSIRTTSTTMTAPARSTRFVRRHDALRIRLTSGSLRTWLGSGALQGPDGAIHAWLNAETGNLAFAYPEITGYALTYLAGRPEPTMAEHSALCRAATWMTERLDQGNYSAREKWDNGAIYPFDLGMIAAGLINAGAFPGMDRQLVTGLGLATKLAHMVDAEGRMPAVIGRNGMGTDRRATWSTVGQPHMAKTVQSLLLAAEHGDTVCAAAAERLIRRTLALQEPDGRFITQDDPSFTMLHPHLYTIEALWMWAMARNDREALEAAGSALDWAWKQQLPTGGFPRAAAVPRVRLAPEDTFEQLDATAQTIRMALMLRPGIDGIQDGCARLVEVAHGVEFGVALPYQPQSDDLHLNAWVTMFAAQALDIATRGPSSMRWQALV